MSILKDNKLYSARFGPGPRKSDGQQGVLVSADPPLHGQQQKAIVQAFNAKTIAAMEPGLRQFVADIVEAVRVKGECDIITDIAIPLPMFMICQMLGISFDEHHEWLRRHVEVAAGLTFSESINEKQQARIDTLSKDLPDAIAFLRGIVQKKIEIEDAGEDPGNDLIGLMVKARVDGARMPEADIENFAHFLLVAGSGTTTNLIGNFFKLMMEFPGQYRLLVDQPGLLDQAIEEVVRFDSPVHGLFRTNNEPVWLGGMDVPANSKICLMWGAANRDPEIFEDPNTFDITRDLRTLRKNLAFGQGLHKCLGAPLARLECRIAVEEFISRIPEFKPGGDPVKFPFSTLKGLDHLPVRWEV